MWPFNKHHHYSLKETIVYKSKRYGKTITVPKGYISDGASGAIDIYSDSWWVHDWICGNFHPDVDPDSPRPEGGVFDDGTLINNKQASQILSDILQSEGRYWRAQYWYTFTWLFGGGKARENGMW